MAGRWMMDDGDGDGDGDGRATTLGTSEVLPWPPICHPHVRYLCLFPIQLIPRYSSLSPMTPPSSPIPSLFSPGLLPLSAAVVQHWYSASTLVHYSPRSVDTSLPGKGEVPLPKGMRKYCVPWYAYLHMQVGRCMNVRSNSYTANSVVPTVVQNIIHSI